MDGTAHSKDGLIVSFEETALRRDEPPSHVPLLDPDILDIEDVARLLRCAVDTVRRIPKSELPVCDGPGKRHLYLREDIILYLRRRRSKGVDTDRVTFGLRTGRVKIDADSVRGRPSKRRRS